MNVLFYRSRFSTIPAEPRVMCSVVEMLDSGKPFILFADKPQKRWNLVDHSHHERAMRVSETIVLSNGHGPLKVVDGHTFIVRPDECCYYERLEETKQFRKWNGEFHYRHTDKVQGHDHYLLEAPVPQLFAALKQAGYFFEPAERHISLLAARNA